jgi:hypothetical protein
MEYRRKRKIEENRSLKGMHYDNGRQLSGDTL